jgi:hypothetical protein
MTLIDAIAMALVCLSPLMLGIIVGVGAYNALLPYTWEE